ncbi:hypothetical protein ACIQXA_11485 [Streptomyces massasporeus]|uniref:hypothetical protein n=1 Tax=Streptomyces massasporeus TaxID=67324 RepID=UPI00382EAFAC
MAPGMHTHHVRRGAHHPGPSIRPGPSTRLGSTPGDHPPGGRPDGVLGNRSLADSGSSRYGDVHAVTPGLRAPLTLVPGLAARTDAADARGSHQDIPLFPG